MSRKKNTSVIKEMVVILPILCLLVLFVLQGCDKDETSSFTVGFSHEFIADNYVQFSNESSGEYYSLVWDFGNGETDTTTDKSQSYLIYYPAAGEYNVSLSALNYTGEVKSSSETIAIASNDFTLAFTAEINTSNPNYITLTNTTVGEYDSFKWYYEDQVVENEMQWTVYYPFAGNYEIELLVSKDGTDHSLSKTVTIAQNDPNYVENMELVWYDEFDYTGLPESSKWNIETGGFGGGNNELQYYTDSQNNLKVDNGVLTITALEEQMGGKDYTSARITTQNKFNFKYGKIEARIKLPYGQGMWPAFWMLGENISTVSWPACGEIDIMEMVGGPGKDNTCHSTLHWDHNGSHADYGESYTLPSGILADDYHLFSVQWEEDQIRGYIDDIHYYTADITPAQLSEFHNNFFIILNLAVGGTWPGSPDAGTSFPQTMEVDYVRVYQMVESTQK